MNPESRYENVVPIKRVGNLPKDRCRVTLHAERCIKPHGHVGKSDHWHKNRFGGEW